MRTDFEKHIQMTQFFSQVLSEISSLRHQNFKCEVKDTSVSDFLSPTLKNKLHFFMNPITISKRNLNY